MHVSQYLSFSLHGKTTEGKSESEPDSGNPTAWDRRGACGNVMHDYCLNGYEARNGGCDSTIANLTIRAPQFLPDTLLPLVIGLSSC